MRNYWIYIRKSARALQRPRQEGEWSWQAILERQQDWYCPLFWEQGICPCLSPYARGSQVCGSRKGRIEMPRPTHPQAPPHPCPDPGPLPPPAVDAVNVPPVWWHWRANDRQQARYWCHQDRGPNHGHGQPVSQDSPQHGRLPTQIPPLPRKAHGTGLSFGWSWLEPRCPASLSYKDTEWSWGLEEEDYRDAEPSLCLLLSKPHRTRSWSPGWADGNGLLAMIPRRASPFLSLSDPQPEIASGHWQPHLPMPSLPPHSQTYLDLTDG